MILLQKITHFPGIENCRHRKDKRRTSESGRKILGDLCCKNVLVQIADTTAELDIDDITKIISADQCLGTFVNSGTPGKANDITILKNGIKIPGCFQSKPGKGCNSLGHRNDPDFLQTEMLTKIFLQRSFDA